ncbi:MAG TPA: AmmeMemoRadiSam system protein B [Spirochaetales bacterium]|nr:AmmeMemoRadiSam system protein B [Spirochaetales bacterium]
MKYPERSKNKEILKPKCRDALLQGLFYPADAQELNEKLGRLLAQTPSEGFGLGLADGAGNEACIQTGRIPQGHVRAIISPHGSLDYSGNIAATAWQSIGATQFDTVVLLGASHRAYVPGVFLSESDFFSVPGKDVPVDRALTRDLVLSNTSFLENDIPHLEEQGLEMQLVFVAKLLPACKILPVIVSDVSSLMIDQLYTNLYFSLQSRLDSTLIVISSNMAVNKDAAACENATKVFVRSILAGDNDAIDALDNVDSSFCGSKLIAGFMRSRFSGGLKASCLGISTSASCVGPEDLAVGYAAVCFGDEL